MVDGSSFSENPSGSSPHEQAKQRENVFSRETTAVLQQHTDALLDGQRYKEFQTSNGRPVKVYSQQESSFARRLVRNNHPSKQTTIIEVSDAPSTFDVDNTTNSLPSFTELRIITKGKKSKVRVVKGYYDNGVRVDTKLVKESQKDQLNRIQEITRLLQNLREMKNQTPTETNTEVNANTEKIRKRFQELLTIARDNDMLYVDPQGGFQNAFFALQEDDTRPGMMITRIHKQADIIRITDFSELGKKDVAEIPILSYTIFPPQFPEQRISVEMRTELYRRDGSRILPTTELSAEEQKPIEFADETDVQTLMERLAPLNASRLRRSPLG